MKLHILIFALVLVALLISAACGDDEEDLVELFEKNLVAYNAGDLAKVLDDYADDAFVKGGQCPKGCTGKEEFGKEIEWRVAGFDSFTLVMPSQARGTFVSWVQEFRGTYPRGGRGISYNLPGHYRIHRRKDHARDLWAAPR